MVGINGNFLLAFTSRAALTHHEKPSLTVLRAKRSIAQGRKVRLGFSKPFVHITSEKYFIPMKSTHKFSLSNQHLASIHFLFVFFRASINLSFDWAILLTHDQSKVCIRNRADRYLQEMQFVNLPIDKKYVIAFRLVVILPAALCAPTHGHNVNSPSVLSSTNPTHTKTGHNHSDTYRLPNIQTPRQTRTFTLF